MCNINGSQFQIMIKIVIKDKHCLLTYLGLTFLFYTIRGLDASTSKILPSQHLDHRETRCSYSVSSPSNGKISVSGAS